MKYLLNNYFIKNFLIYFPRNPTNKEFRTIEDEIVDGLVKINSIPQHHADEMYKVIIANFVNIYQGYFVFSYLNLLSIYVMA